MSLLTSDAPLIEALAVSKSFAARGMFQRGRTVQAVRAVDATVARGETVGLVGESGSGKSTLGRVMLGLTPASSGAVVFDGKPLESLSTEQLRRQRRRMQIVFQDPFGSLDPRRKVGAQIADGLAIHELAPAGERNARVAALLTKVGLDPIHARRFPHEFSGGQRQRIGIARALAVEPRLLICDEPVSALDVSIQAQVVNLFQELQDKLGISSIFVAHDLAVVRHVSQRIAVMYLGTIVEIASRDDLYAAPKHPYTQALLAAIPVPNPAIEAARQHVIIKGEVPSAQRPPPGCRFHPRCPHAMPICHEQAPELKREGQTSVACHLYS